MNTEKTSIQEQIIDLSKKVNPYHKDCKNRHLFNEGFQWGFEYANEWNIMYHGCKSPELGKPVLVKSYTGRVEVATYQLYDGGKWFDKEKELSNFTVEYWREIY